MSSSSIAEVVLALFGLSLAPVYVDGNEVHSKNLILPSYRGDVVLPYSTKQ